MSTPRPLPRLAARAARSTRARVDAPDDLLDALGSRRCRVAPRWRRLRHGRGRGPCSTRTRAAAWLADVEHDDEVGRPGTGPLAVGALPFDPDRARRAARPAADRRPRRRPGVAGSPSSGPSLAAPTRRPGRRRRRSPSASSMTRRRVVHGGRGRARRDRRAASSRRSCSLGVSTSTATHRSTLAHDRSAPLRADQPGCYVYAVDGMVGASPELLVRRPGPTGRVTADGGDALDRRPTMPALARLRASAKDAREHRPVVAAIVATLEPVVRRARGRRRHRRSPASRRSRTSSPRCVGDAAHDRHPTSSRIARALHPTPAVGGAPRAPALAAIRRARAMRPRPLRGTGRLGRRAGRR